MQGLSSRFAAIVALMACLLVSACGSGWAADPSINAKAAGGPVFVDTEYSYRLGVGDKVRITTFGEPTLTGEFSVGGNGVVSLPLIGDVPAQGATVTEFTDRIVSTLRDGYLVDPKVAVEVLTYRPYYMLGEVGRPSEYPYTTGLTVLNAVATAGGFTYRANTTKVFIKHQDASHEQEYPLTVATPVRPGDTVRIAERYF